MKVLVVLVACLVLGVCARHRRSTPSGDSSEESPLRVGRVRYPAKIISSYGVPDHGVLERLRRGLETVYVRRDDDHELANKYLLVALEILDRPITVTARTVAGYASINSDFEVKLKIDNRIVTVRPRSNLLIS